jgi:prepilin-type processing-associated H-X9-DG protein
LGFDSPHSPVFWAGALPEQAFQWVRPGVPCDPRLPGTGHRSGMQAAMADGSVRTFAHGTDPTIFRAACEPP